MIPELVITISGIRMRYLKNENSIGCVQLTNPKLRVGNRVYRP